MNLNSQPEFSDSELGIGAGRQDLLLGIKDSPLLYRSKDVGFRIQLLRIRNWDFGIRN